MVAKDKQTKSTFYSIASGRLNNHAGANSIDFGSIPQRMQEHRSGRSPLILQAWPSKMVRRRMRGHAVADHSIDGLKVRYVKTADSLCLILSPLSGMGVDETIYSGETGHKVSF